MNIVFFNALVSFGHKITQNANLYVMYLYLSEQLGKVPGGKITYSIHHFLFKFLV